MSRIKPWDGVCYLLICPVSGGGWAPYWDGPYKSAAEAERYRMTPIDRVIRVKVRLPKEPKP